MKLAVNAHELAGAMGLATQALDTRIVIEILSAVHIYAGEDGNMRLTVNTLDRALMVEVAAEITEPGEAAVRATALSGLAKGFPKDARITIVSDAQSARVRCGRSAYKLPVLPIENLPPVPALDDVAGEIELDRRELLEALQQVLFAVSTEEMRHYLNGVLLHDVPDRLALVATDSPSVGTLSYSIYALCAGPYLHRPECVDPCDY